MLWYEKGGSGTRVILLLHGLGATSGVWAGVQRVLNERGIGRWISPDLSGHGRSAVLRQYSVGSFAAQLAGLVQAESELFVIGHSLGAYLGLALASRWFGVDVRGVLAIGPKISWPPADVQAAHELATRPVRWYSNSEEAWNRYRRVSGLEAGIAPADEWLRHGVTQSAEGWRLSQDARTFQVAGAPFDSLVAGAKARLVLARGEHDPMVSTSELQAYSPDAQEITAVGHNAHVENPDEIVRLFGTL
ncbi:MAG: alpha/beta hydrolase [Proteobacteria bacterium]|nr:alpha/beta hydrolase [Pseudomonadota bacterium]